VANDALAVRVTGLRELSGAFRKLDAEVSTGVKTGFRSIAEGVAGTARHKAPSQSGRARASIKTRATTRGAGIAFGGSAAPYMPFLDFGGSVGRGHRPGDYWSGAVQRRWISGGRYVYPAIVESKDDTEQAIDKLITSASKAAGFDVSGRAD
jgi:hypothetical protein